MVSERAVCPGQCIRGIRHGNVGVVRLGNRPVADCITVGIFDRVPFEINRRGAQGRRLEVFGDIERLRVDRNHIADIGRRELRLFGIRLNREIPRGIGIGDRHFVTDRTQLDTGPVSLIGAVRKDIVIGIRNRFPRENQFGGRLGRHAEIFGSRKLAHIRIGILVGAQIDRGAADARIPPQVNRPLDVAVIADIHSLGIGGQNQVGFVGVHQNAVCVKDRRGRKERQAAVVGVFSFNGAPVGAGRDHKIAAAGCRRRPRDIPLLGIECNNAVVDIECLGVEKTAAEKPLGLGQRSADRVAVHRRVAGNRTVVKVRNPRVIERSAAGVEAERRLGGGIVVEKFAADDGKGSRVVDARTERTPGTGAVFRKGGGRNRGGTGIIEPAAVNRHRRGGVSRAIGGHRRV